MRSEGVDEGTVTAWRALSALLIHLTRTHALALGPDLRGFSEAMDEFEADVTSDTRRDVLVAALRAAESAGWKAAIAAMPTEWDDASPEDAREVFMDVSKAGLPTGAGPDLDVARFLCAASAVRWAGLPSPGREPLPVGMGSTVELAPPASEGFGGAALSLRGALGPSHSAVLARAPGVVLAAKASGARAAVVLDFIREHGLYKQENFKSLTEYAVQRLGLRGRASYDFYAGAGASIRTYCPGLYAKLLAEVAEGPELIRDGASGAPPPELTVFSLLPRLLKALPEADHAETLAKIEAGQLGTCDVKARIKELGAASQTGSHAPSSAGRDGATSKARAATGRSGSDQARSPHPPASSEEGELVTSRRSSSVPLRPLIDQARRPILVRTVADLEAMAGKVGDAATNLARVPAGNLQDEEHRLRDKALAAIDTLSAVVAELRAAVIALGKPAGAS